MKLRIIKRILLRRAAAKLTIARDFYQMMNWSVRRETPPENDFSRKHGMTPLQVVKELYRKRDLNFQADLDDHLEAGFVVALPTVFAMATVVEFADGRCGWFVRVAAGDLRSLVNLMPFSMPFVGFCRWKTEGRMKIYPTSELKRLVLKKT